MSYILDALKKSERERKHGAVPDVLTVQESMQQTRSRRTLWPVIIVTALFLNIALLMWWFAPWKTDSRRTAAVESPADTQLQGSVRPETSPASRKEELSPSRSQTESVHTDSPKAPSASSGKGVIPLPTSRADRLPDTQPEPGPQEKESDKTKKAEVKGDVHPTEQSASALPPAENRIYRLKELPEPLRKTLPDFTITAFLYSATPSSRMVQINGLMLREGEDLSPGLKLEEITPDGVIMNSRTYRFSIGVQ
jgi:general secretion pathway protein B